MACIHITCVSDVIFNVQRYSCSFDIDLTIILFIQPHAKMPLLVVRFIEKLYVQRNTALPTEREQLCVADARCLLILVHPRYTFAVDAVYPRTHVCSVERIARQVYYRHVIETSALLSIQVRDTRSSVCVVRVVEEPSCKMRVVVPERVTRCVEPREELKHREPTLWRPTSQRNGKRMA